jgi:hypothetical protein
MRIKRFINTTENRELKESEKRGKKREKLTNLGMTLRAVLISHFERMTSVPEPKVVRKQKTKRPYV